jgi:hypothetical protein
MHIAQMIEKIMAQFDSNAVDLVTTTQKEVLQVRANDKIVYYGKLYAKPSKRLSRLLTVENEILILVSAFREQQFRTVAQMRELIDRSEGRLEQTVAILVHCEQYAENKIKKWGRQKGLSILPLYYDEKSFPSGERLESHLVGELFSHDPFDITGPVSDDHQFYGRRTEALDLARKLNAGQIRSYLGIRKIGKTSLLNRCIVEAQKHHAAKCIIIDCSKDNIWKMSAAQLMTAIAESVSTLVKIQALQTTVTSTKSELSINDAADILLAEINKSNQSVLLFFDEVDYITPGSPTGPHWKLEFNVFWRNLRAVYQDTCRFNHNLGIFVSGVSSKWFMVESINGIENAALAFIPEEYLYPMPRGASEQMIKTLARTSGLQFDDESAAFVAEYCSGIPYWIRKACSYIHRKVPIANRPYKIALREIKNILEEFLEQEAGVLSRVAITHLFKVFPELQDAATKIHRNALDDLPRIYLNILEKYGVIKTNPISLSGEMIKEGVKLFVDIIEDKIPTDINFEHHDTQVLPPNNFIFNTYDEWADELAILNRDRNLLEKRLRHLVVNFIRMDSLTNKSKGNTTDRVLKVIETERRQNFANLSPEQIIERFLWSELVKLIDKEWILFSRIFGDKVQFQFQAININQRSDTHAKESDKADIALQRNSIRWFEDKLRQTA